MFLLKLSFRTVKTLTFFFVFFLKAEITDFPFSTAMASTVLMFYFSWETGINTNIAFGGGGLIFTTDISRCTSWWLARSFKTF